MENYKDMRNIKNIVMLSKQLREQKIDMYVACRLLCMAYINSEIEAPNDEELIVITEASMNAWYKSDCVKIESIVQFLTKKYIKKEYTLEQINWMDSYDLLTQCCYGKYF